MHSGPDSSAPSGLTARRSAASNLPSFELPPPPLQVLHSKIPSVYTSHNGNQAQQPSGNLPTPPNTLGSASISPPAASFLPNSSSLGQGVPSAFPPPSYWPQTTPGGSSYAYQPSTSSSQWIPPRGLFSPTSLNSFVRSNSSQSVPTESMTSPAYGDVHLPPFSSTRLGMNTAQQQQAMSVGMSNQGSISGNQPAPMHMQESYGLRPPPTPTYFSQTQPSVSPSQNSFPFSNGTAQSLTSVSGPGAQPHHQQQQQQQQQPQSHSQPQQHLQHQRVPSHGEMPRLHQTMSDPTGQFPRPYSQYPLPAMSGSGLANLHGSNSHMSLANTMSNPTMGGYNSGHGSHMQHMYLPHHMQQPPAPHNDRPFKCDTCIQSFNRNHDLKRHKRIHLAVKPFPCGHCDKSFSRKDALKRHILVKGCGKNRESDREPRSDSQSPLESKREQSSSPI